MSRIAYLDVSAADAETKATYEKEQQNSGYVTNMKKTLLRSLPAYKANVEWYPLRREVEKFTGAKGVAIFSYAISNANQCMVCSLYFYRELKELGISPEEYEFTEKEQVLEEFGKRIASYKSGVDDAFFARLKRFYSEEEIVALTVLGTMLVSSNMFNDILQVEPDDNLSQYRKVQ